MPKVAPLPPQSNDGAAALLSTLNEFTQWRTQKKTPAEKIPDELWLKLFSHETTHSIPQLRSIFNVTNKQYEQNQNRLLANTETQKNEAKESSLSNELPKLCEVTLKAAPENPYKPDALPSGKTLVVEFCRSDGQIMKIHTTQDSIPTLMQSFLGE